MMDFIDDKLIDITMDALERSKPRVIAKKAVKFTGIAAAAAAACFVIPLGISRLGETVPAAATDAATAGAALQAAEDGIGEVPLPVEVVRDMEQERATEALKGFAFDEIVSAWGVPDLEFPERSGGMWASGDRNVAVYFVDGKADRVMITDSEDTDIQYENQGSGVDGVITTDSRMNEDSISVMISPVADGYVIALSEESGGYAGHKGIDIGSAQGRGTPILAASDGTVTFADYESGYGYHIRIDHGNGYETLYAHCDSLLVTEGQSVKQGEVIAEMGASGFATSYHLHFEVFLNGENVDPAMYVDIERAADAPPQALPETDMTAPINDEKAVITAYFAGSAEEFPHSGVDIRAMEGTPVYAAADGVVTTAQSENAAGVIEGIYLVIEHANGYETVYEHCSKLHVSEGQQVTRGELIAEVGSTGFSTGAHLHFGVKLNGVYIDPMSVAEGFSIYAAVREEQLPQPLPQETLPETLATESDLDFSGGYLLLAQLPEKGLYMYCRNAQVRDEVFFRFYDEWYSFPCPYVWSDTSVLPRMEYITINEFWGLRVDYLRPEGIYTDENGNTSPGLVSDCVTYTYFPNGKFIEERFRSGGTMQTSEEQNELNGAPVDPMNAVKGLSDIPPDYGRSNDIASLEDSLSDMQDKLNRERNHILSVEDYISDTEIKLIRAREKIAEKEQEMAEVDVGSDVYAIIEEELESMRAYERELSGNITSLQAELDEEKEYEKQQAERVNDAQARLDAARAAQAAD